MVHPERKDPKAFAELQVVIDVITALRKLRSEQGVEPSRKVTAIIHSKEYEELLGSQKEHILRLANLESAEIDATPRGHDHAVSAFLAGVEVHLPLAGLIDVAKEKARLTQEQEDLSRYIAGIEKKLSMSSFVERAPADVVAAEREKLATAQEKLAKVEERLKKM
jgi:valyl-tRNA synthetase